MKNIIIDLDGTLANIDHRLHYINCDKPDWDTFNKKVEEDKVNKWCKYLMSEFYTSIEDYKIIIVSARHKSTEKLTKKWLRDNHISDSELCLLRDDNDYAPDDELKQRWLDSMGTEFKKNILFVVDDRQKVVDMWRREGLVCLQCYQWKEYKG